jgi:hypothetical protein
MLKWPIVPKPSANPRTPRQPKAVLGRCREPLPALVPPRADPHLVKRRALETLKRDKHGPPARKRDAGPSDRGG